MSSDSQPSFRIYTKNKFKKVIKSNITSSIREHFISNETYNNIRKTSHNLTETVIDRTGLGKIINKTKELIPDRFSSDDNSTIAKGFYDSLFHTQTENDVYLKVAVICLWIIAMICIILTIITMFIPVGEHRQGTTRIKMIFLHIFVCELFYLIYILLSMINVGLDFQLNSFWCDIAKYAMYATIPIMYLVLLILSIERIIKHFNLKTPWTIIFTNICINQFILILIWTICITIITIFVVLKRQVIESVTNLPGKFIPTRFSNTVDKIFSFNRCSIDGQLLPPFKILFIILFVILIVLIIKSLLISTIYGFFGLSCLRTKKKKEEHDDDHMTSIFVIFLLLNLVFSFPYYFISMANSIAQLILRDKTFSIKLKISFIFRIISIILQCLVFYTLESNSWSLLNKLIHRVTCKKISALKYTNGDVNKPTPAKQTRNSNKLKDNVESDGSEVIPNRHQNNGDTNLSDTDQSEDSVFIDGPRNKALKSKKLGTTEESMTDQDESDNETKAIQKRKLSTKKKDIVDKLTKKRDETEDEELPIKKPTSKYNNTTGISERTANGKPPSQRISSATTDRKTSKSNTRPNRVKYDSIPPDSSADEISNVSVNSDDEIKPSTIKPKIQPVTRSSSNKAKRTSTVLPSEHRSHHQRHRTTRPQVSRSITTASNNHHHIGPVKSRRKSPRNINNHTEKPKQDRLSRILANSVEV